MEEISFFNTRTLEYEFFTLYEDTQRFVYNPNSINEFLAPVDPEANDNDCKTTSGQLSCAQINVIESINKAIQKLQENPLVLL